MRHFSKIAATLFGLGLAAPATAEITVELGGGSIVVTGELISFEDGIYLIRTLVGDIRMDADMVECVAGDCPDLAPAEVVAEPVIVPEPVPEVIVEITNDLRILSSGQLNVDVLPRALAEYAQLTETTFQPTEVSSSFTAGLLLNADGETVAEIETSAGSDAAAFAALLTGDVEMIVTRRKISENEVQQFVDAGLGDLTTPAREKIIGQYGVAVLTSPSSPIEGISAEQAAGIFSGRLTNWSELGGPDAPIRAFAPDAGDAIADMFDSRVLTPNLDFFGSGVERSLDGEAIALAVNDDPTAIGLVSLNDATSARIAAFTSSCGIQAVPSAFTIRSEDYPLSDRVYVYTSTRPVSDHVAGVVGFLQSNAGQAIVEDGGFISLDTDRADLNSFGQRLAYALSSEELAEEIPNLSRFARQVVDADRLSTTFRFDVGSSQLNNKARADVLRLATLLQEPEYQGAEILLVGFTDSIGGTAINTPLSARRAEQVLADVVEISGGALNATAMTSFGFGAANPVSCNDNEAGRELNRRVEVWVR